jgi:hypothetical protein
MLEFVQCPTCVKQNIFEVQHRTTTKSLGLKMCPTCLTRGT